MIFSRKLIEVINKIAPLKEIRINDRTQDWFDGEISYAITLRNNNFQIFKRSKSILDEQTYKNSKLFVQNLIKDKKKTFFENKLTENIGKPKEL